jgi:hypothetical protein
MSLLSRICHYSTSDGVPRRSLFVALTVGTILNLINQADVLFGGGRLNLTKIALTFAVPYCVATYGAVSYRLSMGRTDASAVLSETGAIDGAESRTPSK